MRENFQYIVYHLQNTRAQALREALFFFQRPQPPTVYKNVQWRNKESITSIISTVILAGREAENQILFLINIGTERDPG